jgi:hypothetical protein
MRVAALARGFQRRRFPYVQSQHKSSHPWCSMLSVRTLGIA